MKSNWLLPENLSDILPAEARRIEELRRDLLDLYRTYGFELVAPPMVEYLDSLMLADDEALRLRTCKLVDQLSGLTMGVRADITVQVSRIDAHLLNRPGVTRLCYCGPVVHARPAGLLSDRELLQIGAEIFGHAGIQADIETIRLALESVRRAGVVQPRLDLNHPGVGRALVEADPALAEVGNTVFDLLSVKDVPGLEDLCRQSGARADTLTALRALTSLYGDLSVVDRARARLPALPTVQAALDALKALCEALPDAPVAIDLADMGGSYGYHSGVVFSIYAEGWHDALVRGGRYDGIGRKFGRARPATGFSLDLRKLSAGLPEARPARAIRAPWSDDPALVRAVRDLRKQGHIVIQVLPGEPQRPDEFQVDRELVSTAEGWALQPMNA
ncbi:MAG: ATP phosphoribosyltransferase regulatory subunit [Castellaniella sp.]|uniref:ATP phosphoribosyltransferase regulatory subunit n=1 Tax=Castellaniella sp. TaxID=1955812 RepID=UPI0011F87E57|nr:ATP phosphoribosyltransferase regulatory subunit [Castellaniella sp.]TAN26637.1 MAG: ATP phosphoribosyltransferase regulatory subunit [Castellaniella sp.]